MNDLEHQLSSAVTASASFDAAGVAARVTDRRRRRRRVGVATATVVVLLVAGGAWAWFGGDEAPDVEAVDDPPTTTVDDGEGPLPSNSLEPYDEDPVGSDGEVGTTSDVHVETDETFGFAACGADGEPGPPSDERAAELDDVIDDLRAAGLHDQPFVTSSGGPQSIWGVLSIGLSARYEPTLQWIADRVSPADACIEFPEFGVRNLPPQLAEVDVVTTDGVVTVRAVGCQPKGEWVEPFIRGRVDGPGAQVGIAIGRGQLVFQDDCPAAASYEFELGDEISTATGATTPGTLLISGPVAPGETVDFTFDGVNAASPTIGDDLIAQHADDSTVQFQVSDIFSGSPVAGLVGPVATDQWPAEGPGTIVVPAGVPAGTYHVRLIDSPEINGTLEVVGRAGGVALGPDWGWRIPDLDGDGEDDIIDGTYGQVFLAHRDGVTPLLDAEGFPMFAPRGGGRVFTCNPDGRLLKQSDSPIDDDQFSRHLAELVVVDGLGEWVTSPSFVFGVGDAPLPNSGEGCEPFGVRPTPASVAEGPWRDFHVEARDLVFPECESLPQTGISDEEHFEAVMERLRADEVLEQPFISSVGGPGFGFVDAVDVTLERRYQPTLDWLAARAAPEELCLFQLPPVGYFTQPASFHEWELVGDIGPDDTMVTLARAPGECIASGEQYPPIVRYLADRIEIGLPVARVASGVTTTGCVDGGEQVVDLVEPVGARTLVPWDGPTLQHAAEPVVAPVEVPFTVQLDLAGLGGAMNLGDDVMIQAVDDPSFQIQVGGVFTEEIMMNSEPGPFVADRWAPTESAMLVLPAGSPSGQYTFVFIEHPQFWGTFSVD